MSGVPLLWEETKLNQSFFPRFECCLFVSDFQPKTLCFSFYTNSALKCHQSSDETAGDIFIQVVASASLISIFLPPTLKLQPIVGDICSHVKPTIWQSRPSKPKPGCADSWRLPCKIQQKNKLLLPPPSRSRVFSVCERRVLFREPCFKNKLWDGINGGVKGWSWNSTGRQDVRPRGDQSGAAASA